MDNNFNIFLIFSGTDFKGEIAALSAACLWAVASTIYGRLGERIPPLQLNLLKGIIAIAFLLLSIPITGEWLPNITVLPLCLLLTSGIVGISLGDTAFLAAINYLGARRVLVIGTLAPPIAAILALIFLQEKINLSAWCGILLTVLGVAWVITERTPDEGTRTRETKETGNVAAPLFASPFWKGIGFSLLAVITNATGMVLSRAAFIDRSINPLWAALLRLSAAELVLLIWFTLRNRQGNYKGKTLHSRQFVMTAIFASFCGTFLGIWLQQTAVKFTAAGIATTLMQTSPLFVIPLAKFMGERVSLRAIAGAVVAIVGVGWLFYLK
ncbi:DMT family transporter [Tolypothrix bouteillei VB521301]|uniref:DMT family transporter n=1 Tax=Tolypothrix bouteillei VB521301 TaxID=1479485 RepID=A0A8S9TJ15_9CYAN|nr:DMT family transporter [Tolypothrix bouteillei VB521301]